MNKDVYFFDSYAIIEILKGDVNYKQYVHAFVMTTKLNIFEVFYSILREGKEIEAYQFLEEYYEFCIDYDKEIIMNAVKLRMDLKKRNVSMTDCIGYCIAKKWRIRFLTGDKEFERLENVEFVK